MAEGQQNPGCGGGSWDGFTKGHTREQPRIDGIDEVADLSAKHPEKVAELLEAAVTFKVRLAAHPALP